MMKGNMLLFFSGMALGIGLTPFLQPPVWQFQILIGLILGLLSIYYKIRGE